MPILITPWPNLKITPIGKEPKEKISKSTFHNSKQPLTKIMI
jgi:hypothetical protein